MPIEKWATGAGCWLAFSFGCAGFASCFGAVGVSFQWRDFGVVDEPDDHGSGDDVVAEDVTPAGERHVRRDDEGCVFVAGCDQLEEQVPGVGVERDVADFIDDQ